MKRLRQLKFLVFWVLVGILFLLTVAVIIVYAAGYKVNFEQMSIQKTVLFIFKSTPKDAIVYINGQPQIQRTPLRSAGMLPGFYDFKVEKSGYQTWTKSLEAEEGLAYDFDSIVLFLESPAIEEVQTPPEGISAAVPDPDLFTDNGEIWYKDKLVTRLSQEIKHAVVYPDKRHIVFQVNGEIKVVELDGRNNTLLVKLEHEDKTVFGFQDNDILLYQDGPIVKRAKIL